MIDPKNVPPVGIKEVVARYVLASKASKLVYEDGTAKHGLFNPYKQLVSVNRHLGCTESEIWEFGYGVANFRKKPLQGRFDLTVASCTFEGLKVNAEPIEDDPDGVPDNPNHADIAGFPKNKPDQKSFVLKLADNAGKRIPPPSIED